MRSNAFTAICTLVLFCTGFHQPVWAEKAKDAEDAPTQGMQERHVELQAQLLATESRYQELVNNELASYQKALLGFSGLVAPVR
jgi:hypothetical protein